MQIIVHTCLSHRDMYNVICTLEAVAHINVASLLFHFTF